ncbi:transketolase [Thermostilla marina]
MTDIERLAVDTIRTLSMDAVQAANSGHPGTPMALAPVAYSLFQKQMRYAPTQPAWPNRDRFILSCGHASMLLYSILHLAQVKQLDAQGNPTDEPAVPLEHIKLFRQLESRCPGHPEYRHTSGVEMTTGPLGQGVATSVGMAIAGKWLAARYNRPGFDLFDYRVFVLCSDGDLMEGVSAEAASLVGHLKLDNLCWIYDDNKITIEGDTNLAFSEDVRKRFEACGWNVLEVDDVNDLPALNAAIESSRSADRPTLVIVHSVIAWGAPNKQNTHGAHGAPLGEDEIRLTKEAYGWPADEKFRVPEEVVAHFREGVVARGEALFAEWRSLREEYAKQYPQEAAELDAIAQGGLPEGWDAEIPEFPADAKGMATRASSGKVLNAIAKNLPWLVGGSADLAPSNNTELKFEEAGHFSAENRAGRNLHFGIREHVMGSIANGMALCGLKAYTGTFFVFSDYMRPPMRLAALMELPVVYIFTHDSIGVGEDGPTHQPVEHLAALRAIPNLTVIRPADANEVAEAYRVAIRSTRTPTALVLTRQALPTVDRGELAPASELAKGAYVLKDAPDGNPAVVLIGTGSEVAACLAAQEQLAGKGIAARVVSMPSWELFDAQDAAYKASVLPPEVPRVAVEAGIDQGWHKYIGEHGAFVGMQGFGASAPAAELFAHFGITAERIAAEAERLLGK